MTWEKMGGQMQPTERENTESSIYIADAVIVERRDFVFSRRSV